MSFPKLKVIKCTKLSEKVYCSEMKEAITGIIYIIDAKMKEGISIYLDPNKYTVTEKVYNYYNYKLGCLNLNNKRVLRSLC